jgi:hypothetical protein
MSVIVAASSIVGSQLMKTKLSSVAEKDHRRAALADRRQDDIQSGQMIKNEEEIDYGHQ